MTVVEQVRGLNEEQLAAVEATGNVFVSAGAGTGRRPCSSSATCARSAIRASTSTRSSSSPTPARPPASFAPVSGRGSSGAGGPISRGLDGAWISTIHGFCNRLLKAHPFAVGLDPRFRELEDAGAAVLRGEAFERARGVLRRGRPGASAPARHVPRGRAPADADGRVRGRSARPVGLVLELGPRTSVADAIFRFRGGVVLPRRRCVRDREPTSNGGGGAALTGDASLPERLVDLSGLRCRGVAPRRTSSHGRRARARGSRRPSRGRPRTSSSCCSSASRTSTRLPSAGSPWWTSRISSSPPETCSHTTSR